VKRRSRLTAWWRWIGQNPANEENAGRAELACGDVRAAVEDLEKAVELDPLALSAVEVLEAVYRKTGDFAKQEALAGRIREAMKAVPGPEGH
jgi:tetratricopeptide (TPR) repeat protein